MSITVTELKKLLEPTPKSSEHNSISADMLKMARLDTPVDFKNDFLRAKAALAQRTIKAGMEKLRRSRK